MSVDFDKLNAEVTSHKSYLSGSRLNNAGGKNKSMGRPQNKPKKSKRGAE